MPSADDDERNRRFREADEVNRMANPRAHSNQAGNPRTCPTGLSQGNVSHACKAPDDRHVATIPVPATASSAENREDGARWSRATYRAGLDAALRDAGHWTIRGMRGLDRRVADDEDLGVAPGWSGPCPPMTRSAIDPSRRFRGRRDGPRERRRQNPCRPEDGVLIGTKKKGRLLALGSGPVDLRPAERSTERHVTLANVADPGLVRTRTPRPRAAAGRDRGAGG